MFAAIACPSRGLIFAKTVECIVEGMKESAKMGIATTYISTHNLPIPDGHNTCVELALQDKSIQKILFVEEDMYFSPQAFVALLTSDFDVSTLQYNDKNGRPKGIIEYDEKGDVVWCGLGATAIKRSTFENLDKPYFYTKRRWTIKRSFDKTGKMIKSYEQLPIESEYQYGGLDVDFCMRVKAKNMLIKDLKEYKAAHFQLVSLGKPHENYGLHNIRQV